MRTISWTALVALVGMLLPAAPVCSQEAAFDQELLDIAQQWDRANFASPTSRDKRDALEALSKRTASFVKRYPDRAEPLVWDGITLSSLAGAKGGLGALGLAKQSRARLLAALEKDPEALNGSAYTSLGVLYYKVPGFPMGFGNHAKAREYLRKALEINPDGIDPNYFYAELLFEDGDYAQALSFLQKAQSAPPRAQRTVADQGRRKQIADLMQRAQQKRG